MLLPDEGPPRPGTAPRSRPNAVGVARGALQREGAVDRMTRYSHSSSRGATVLDRRVTIVLSAFIVLGANAHRSISLRSWSAAREPKRVFFRHRNKLGARDGAGHVDLMFALPRSSDFFCSRTGTLRKYYVASIAPPARSGRIVSA
jgi:hypothetical protein